MSAVIRHTRCPQCARRGSDRHADNLAVYEDGHSYCFACHYYIHPPNSIERMKKKLYKTTLTKDEPYELDSGRITHNLPPVALRWLDKYSITADEIRTHNFFWDTASDSLVLPVLDGERIVHTTARYMGTNPDHPKYVTKGWKHGYFKVVTPLQPTNVWILVEDYLSAVKVGRQYNAIPLFGTFAPRELILHLIQYSPFLRFWLDRNKAIESMKQAARTRQWISNCATIITELDPKEYSNEQIKVIVSESLRHPFETTTQEKPVPKILQLSRAPAH